MGLMDKWVARYAERAPDYQVVLDVELGPDGPCLAWAVVIPSAYERSGGGRDLGSRLVYKAVNTAINSVSTSNHIGGDDGSIARQLPVESHGMMLALTGSALTLWDFGVMLTDLPPELRVRLQRSALIGFTDTGKKAQGGVQVVRLTFSDQSFFDYRIMSTSGPEFWTQAAMLAG